MSTIVTKKRICDRCKRELRYPLYKMLVKRQRIITITTRRNWTSEYSYGYRDRYRELCNECKEEFYRFMNYDKYKITEKEGSKSETNR